MLSRCEYCGRSHLPDSGQGKACAAFLRVSELERKLEDARRVNEAERRARAAAVEAQRATAETLDQAVKLNGFYKLSMEGVVEFLGRRGNLSDQIKNTARALAVAQQALQDPRVADEPEPPDRYPEPEGPN